MSDPVFTPAKAPTGATAPAGAQLVYLREVLFAIKGVYHHPLTDAEAPLPPHRWAVVNEVEEIYVESGTSDANGVAMVLRPEEIKGKPDAEWDLWLIPMFEDKADSSEVAELGEVWIDVDTNQWVRPKEMVDIARIETRRLLRIPRWTSHRKALSFGGGFRELPPGATDFDKTGRIKSSDLAPHGTLDKPWTIAIDEGWMHTFVQLRFYDPVQKKEIAVPKGLILDAQGIGKDADGTVLGSIRVGASSVRRDDGSIYILHNRIEAAATDLDYQFDTPEHTTFTYKDGTFASKEIDDLARLEMEYPVAPQWHSFGHEAWEGAVDSTPAARKAFSAIRAKGTTAASPLSFHLDDMVLTSLTAPSTIPVNQKRLAIYTTLAKLHDPTQANGKDVPYSKLTASIPLRAEDAMFRRGKDFDELTRFIDWEGELYEVSTKFASGVIGTTACIGARAADQATPIQDNADDPVWTADITSGHRTYFFDTRWVHYTHNKIKGRISHLVCYVSVFVDGAQLNPANADAVGVLENLLVEASKRWDQKHPGIPDNASQKKDYAVVPASGFMAESTVIKVRHVFGSRSLVGTQAIIVQVDTQPGRATGGRTMRLYCQYGPNMGLPPNPAWLTAHPETTIPGAVIPVRPYSFEPKGSGTPDRLDSDAFQYFTFGHELGHESGLLDEYLEGIDGATLINAAASETLPRFDQWGIRARPYYLDANAMMEADEQPRLRYIWNYVDALHRSLPSTDWFIKEAPFVAEYVAASRTLRHAIPVSPADYLSARGGPWTATTGTQGDCNLSFYPTGADEGMIGPAVLPSGFIGAGKEFDGILVIHPHIWVTFAPAITEGNLTKWGLLTPWATLYFDQKTTPHFAIETPAAKDAKRVLLVFQPRFEFGPTPTIRAAGPPQVLETIGAATLGLRVTRGGVGAAYAAGAPPVLSVDENWLSGWILRYALLTKPAPQPFANKLPTTAADLSMLPSALATMLGRAEIGTVVPYSKA